MLITLAYAYEGHGPNETIDVPDVVGRQLVRDGQARFPQKAVIDERTVPELRTYAAGHDIDLAGLTRKDEIVAAIQAAEQARTPSTSPISTPVTPGDHTEGGPRGR